MKLEITFKDDFLKRHNDFFWSNPLPKVVTYGERDAWVKTVEQGYNYDTLEPCYVDYLCANCFKRSRGETPEIMWFMRDIESWRTYDWDIEDYCNLIEDLEPLWIYHDRDKEKRIGHLLHIMEHCLGLDHKKPYKRHGRLFYRPYRNYFTTREDIVWQALEKKGLAKMYRSGDLDCYEVTDLGRSWLGKLINVHIYEEDA